MSVGTKDEPKHSPTSVQCFQLISSLNANCKPKVTEFDDTIRNSKIKMETYLDSLTTIFILSKICTVIYQKPQVTGCSGHHFLTHGHLCVLILNLHRKFHRCVSNTPKNFIPYLDAEHIGRAASKTISV